MSFRSAISRNAIAFSTATAINRATSSTNAASAAVNATGVMRPNPSVPSGRFAVVSGTMQVARTPNRRMESTVLGQRVSAARSSMTRGSWLRSTHPDGDSSGGWGRLGSAPNVPVVWRTCRVIVSVAGSWSTSAT